MILLFYCHSNKISLLNAAWIFT